MTDNPDNTVLWDRLAKTDPKATKEFTRAGGFKGKAIKPIYTERKMTEVFGPCGTGWGIREPQFTTVNAGDDILVYCTAVVWYERDGKHHDLVGVGGDVVLKKNRDGRLMADDEAFKKAFTDAVGNAMKHIGMSADVHMGQHDDDKYVTALRREFDDSGAVSGETPSPATDPKGTDKGSHRVDPKTAEIDEKATKKANEIIADIQKSPSLADAFRVLHAEGLADITDGRWLLDPATPIDWLNKARPLEYERIKDAYNTFQNKDIAA